MTMNENKYMTIKEAISLYNNEITEDNFYRVIGILRGSNVWIPCNTVMSENDMERWMNRLRYRRDSDEIGAETFQNEDPIRLVPDILRNGEEYFFPVFTSEEEMGEYGNSFSKVERVFHLALGMAENNENKLAGMVVNAFTEPFVLPMDIVRGLFHLFDNA